MKIILSRDARAVLETISPLPINFTVKQVHGLAVIKNPELKHSFAAIWQELKQARQVVLRHSGKPQGLVDLFGFTEFPFRA